MHQRRTPRVFRAVAVAIACGVISPRITRGADVTVFAGPGDQWRVDVAAAGATLLVVWQDDSGSDLDIRAMRVDSGGAVLGAVFDICTATGDQSWPAVASDGTGWLIVWQDERSGSGNAEVWAARVDSGGNVAEADGFGVSSGTGAENYPDVAWTGSAYLVAWQDSRDFATTDWDIFAARVGTDGVVQDVAADAIKITGMDVQDAVAVAGNGGSALVVCRHGGANDIQGVVVASDGTPGTPFSICAAGSTQKNPSVAFGRGVYLVSWEDYRDTSGYPDVLNADVYAARVSTAGVLLDATHVPVAKASDKRSASPAVAFDGANFVVAWEDGPDAASDIRIARVLADTVDVTVRDIGGFIVSAGPVDEEEPSVAPAGTGALVVWADARVTDPRNVYATALGTNDPPLADAGADILAWWDADVTLDGWASTDPEGLPLTYSWVQVPAPTVTLAGADTPAPDFTAPGATETLTFELTVSDGVLSATRQVVVVVAPPPPAGASGGCGASGTDGMPPLLALMALAVGVFVRRSVARASRGGPAG